ncbi:hypothetical protein ABWK35_18030, partial [Bacillus safensis]|uniref:hypothetical protein n=1 Tax=Bacillus safensis TaxID=561879 RepID=UPI003392E76E
EEVLTNRVKEKKEANFEKSRPDSFDNTFVLGSLHSENSEKTKEIESKLFRDFFTLFLKSESHLLSRPLN